MFINSGMHGSKQLKSGGGFLLRQRFDIVQTIFCFAVISLVFSNKPHNIGMTPLAIIISRSLGPSPAIFPKVHTACSITLTSDDLSKSISKGTAPTSTIETVFSDVPDAILVNIHEHSY